MKKAEEPKVEEPVKKTEEPKVEVVEVKEPVTKVEEPKKAEEPAKKAEELKVEEPVKKMEEPKAEEPVKKTEEPAKKAEEPKVEVVVPVPAKVEEAPKVQEKEKEKEKEPEKESKILDVPLVEETIVHSGELEKMGGGLMKKWQPRKFELTDDKLRWFIPGDVFFSFSAFSYSSSSFFLRSPCQSGFLCLFDVVVVLQRKVRNSIQLKEITAVLAVDEHKFKRKHVIQLTTSKKLYFLMANQEAVFTQWMQLLTKATAPSGSAAAGEH